MSVSNRSDACISIQLAGNLSMSESRPEEKGFYRVEEQIRSESECKCPGCVLWTIVFDDPEPTEIGTAWQGDEGKEVAEDICDLMNMAFDAGREKQELRHGECDNTLSPATIRMLEDAEHEDYFGE